MTKLQMMKLQMNQVKLEIDNSNYTDLTAAIAKRLGVKSEVIKDLKILKKSIDARKKPQILFIFNVQFEVENKYITKKALKDKNIIKVEGESTNNKIIVGDKPMRHRPAVIGGRSCWTFCRPDTSKEWL